jgi:thiol:disulfide interchange protein DsbA
MRQLRILLAILAMLFATQALAQSEGAPKYTVLDPAQPTESGDKVEVLEFFFYGCIHCYHLHPTLSAWEKTMPKDVKLDFVPVSFQPTWEPMSYTFYALKAMGKLKALDDLLYKAWNVENQRLVKMDDIADFVASQGVNRQTFLENFQSFSVRSDVQRSKQALVQYHIEGTPTLVVDGKYAITGLEPDETIRVLNNLIRKARKERSKR